jgi:hypothetical protein
VILKSKNAWQKTIWQERLNIWPTNSNTKKIRPRALFF